jgi:hypothetical protein
LSDTLLVEVGKPPEVIVKLKKDRNFQAGRNIVWQCRGFVDGVKLPKSAHDWDVVMLHDQHLHLAMSEEVILELGLGFLTDTSLLCCMPSH